MHKSTAVDRLQSTTKTKDNEGNVKPQKSFMRIIPNSEYYLEYHVMDKDYNEVTDKEVLVHITLETTEF